MKCFFSGVTWIYFPSRFFLRFSLLLYFCASKQRASPLLIITGPYSSLASLPQSASADHNIPSLLPCLWMRCRTRCTARTGHNQNPLNKKSPPSAPLTFATPAGEREHLVFTFWLWQDLKLS